MTHLKSDIEKMCHELGADWGHETMVFEICDVLEGMFGAVDRARFMEKLQNRMIPEENEDEVD